MGMKKLYIRFFENTDGIPANSEEVLKQVIDGSTMVEAIGACRFMIEDWMNQYPKGKVDFVWLF